MTETLNVIGDLSTARAAAGFWTALRAERDTRGYGAHPADVLPSSWRWMGSGCSRHAYLAPDGVIYKVGINNDNISDALAYAIRGMLDHPKFAIPAASVFRIPGGPGEEELYICAMEYCGTTECAEYDRDRCACYDYCGCSWDDEQCVCSCSWGLDYRAAAEFFGHDDLHPGNLRWHKGKIYCIDLGWNNIVSGV